MGDVIEPKGDTTVQPAVEDGSQDELSDIEVDGSSSLSEIEDKDAEPDEDDGEVSELSNESDEHDSEAETERLENSPQVRKQKNVVLNSRSDSHTYERSPSKLNKQLTIEDVEDEDDDEPLSEADMSANGSPKSLAHEDGENGAVIVSTSLEDSTEEVKKSTSVETETRKRKRSIMIESTVEDDSDAPLRKRTGSIPRVDEYTIDDDTHHDEEVDTSNPMSGNITADEAAEAHDEETHDDPDEHEEAVAPDDNIETVEVPVSARKRGRKKRKGPENGVQGHEDTPETPADEDAGVNGEDELRNGEEDNVDVEGDDEAEAALKNEEELEKKRIAMEQLSTIERQFTTFRDRLYEERLEQLNKEEAMLRQDKPTHPEYLAMMKCIDARRDEKLRISENLRKYELQSLRNYAVARRSQILVQYHQDVRDVREKKLEQLGKQWYEIQHDRRSYAGSVPDYSLKFPTRRSQQVLQQIAYNNEVSILSGVAKYVGFPAAPPMVSATQSEVEEDLEKMGRTKQQSKQHQRPGLPLQELAALRTAGSTSVFKPAEEQFIEQTPWANPQHPSHAHLLQRQASVQQAPRTKSPFPQQGLPRRHSHQPGSSGPISGTFSSSQPAILSQTNGVAMSGGRVSPHNAFANSTHPHSIAPSPLGSRQTSPQQSRPPQSISEQARLHGVNPDLSSNGSLQVSQVANVGGPREFSVLS
ncbi:Sds3-like-domain-containing protein [Xylogone sp. PMI_703]|nr:Sds3-like-domain-containing protein [Xylogone sp. PMI_703]